MTRKTLQVYGFVGLVPAETVKQLLERSSGAGTIYAIKVREGKRGRSFAIVQFTTIQAAEVIISLANDRRLWHGSSYLTARNGDRDIVPKPRISLHQIDGTSLLFGCQISNDKFSILWKVGSVSVDFGIKQRKFNFQLPQLDYTQYKLDLSYENIWHISLHRPRGCHVAYLLIQLFGAPRIYIYDGESSQSQTSSLLYNYCKDGSDEQWVRTTDFTLNSCIGQSSSVCLVLPDGCQLPDFQENFPNYKESDEPFALENGRSYSCNLDLVPIVRPPEGINLPYNILFKINLLLQNGCLSGPCLDSSFYRMVDPRRMNVQIIENALERMYHLKECCYEPVRWLYDHYVKIQRELMRKPRGYSDSTSISLDEGLVYVHRVQITPCKVYFFGPEINVSNHVLRAYSEYTDNFLRVSFVDETLDSLYSMDLAPRSSSGAGGRRTEVYRRIVSTLKNGITIGDKKFEFLAFSSSQLRENSAWMFAPRGGLTAAVIREKMGDFHQIKNVAKYAARLGQSFSSSTETLTVPRYETERIADIERNGYTFSDGIGKISQELAKRVALKCGLKGYVPSAFQIRYGGFKGVVAVDPTSSVKLSLRKSMSKYESTENKLNVIAWSKYQPCFLNRQLVALLSTLGVADHVFERKQKEAVDQLDAILTDPLKAQEALDLMAPGENTQILKEMIGCGYKPDEEPFLAMMLRTFRASKLFDLRTKTRIFLPNGRAMMGCLDETGTLQYGQVFVQYSGRSHTYDDAFSSTRIGSASGRHYLCQGKIVVAKNPCLHPGDVRVLTAVNAPALYHMVDCVVFPQKGMRPHPNECSGSDLDGDIYFVSWDPSLIPHCQDPPMDYTPAPTVELDHAVTIEEVEEYFADYILNESLGRIANAHTVFADMSPFKARSKECIELAKLFSVAVDFPKTGVPAEIPHTLYAKEYPDFMEKLDKPTYESRNVIGKLFRMVKDIAPESSQLRTFTKEVAARSFDRDMVVDGYDNYIEDAYYYKSKYDTKLGDLMDYYGIRTEGEILSGCIMKMSKSFTKRRDADSITMAVKALRKEARSWFNTELGDDDIDAKASAWYYVTYHPSYWGCYNEGLKRDHYLSFAWSIYDKLVHIKHCNNSTTSYMTMRMTGLRLV